MLDIFLLTLPSENPEINNIVNYPSVTSLFFRILFTLIFIIFLTYLVLRIIKRQQNFQQNQKKWVKILDYQALGVNKGLYLLDLYDSICIVAVSDGQINILKEIDPSTEKWEKIKNSLQESEDLLTKGIGRLLKNKKVIQLNDQDLPEEEFNQYLSEQLRRNRYLSRDIFQGRDKKSE